MKAERTFKWTTVLGVVFFAVSLMPSAVAQTTNTWDGDAGAGDVTWGTAANWDGSDTLPAFDGTDNLVITTAFFGSGIRTNDMDGDRIINSLEFGDGSTSYIKVLVGGTLTLTSGTLRNRSGNSASTPTTYDVNIVLSNGTAGAHTADWRELNNSSGGATINGAITQAAGENWTIEFRKNSSRGGFQLTNTGNDVTEFKPINTIVTFEVNGAQGNGNITLTVGGGGFAFAQDDFYDNPFDETIGFSANGTLQADTRTRYTGTIDQSTRTLTYAGGSWHRLENTDMTGSDTGSTLINADISAASMSKFSGGSIDLNLPRATLILSGAGGNDVPTWGDFTNSRTYNQSGGAGAWRITSGGGFAAKDVDIVIPKDASTTDKTFARDFTLGTSTSTGGVRYANNAIRIEQDINLSAAATTSPMRWYITGGKITDSTTEWELSGPIHEISGLITGGSVNNRLAFTGQGSSKDSQAGLIGGMIRISNAANDVQLQDLYIGTDRHLTNFGSSDDNSGLVAIFTSDGAFGNAANVEVVAGGDSGRVANMLLFEDTASGTTFGREFSIQAGGGGNRQSGFGSYAGSVTYTGTVTLINGGSSDRDLPIHVESGTLTFDGTTLQNDRTSTTVSYSLNKGGAGTLVVSSLNQTGARTAINPTNNWDVWNGTLLWNATDAGGAVLDDFDVHNGATLGGTGTIDLGANKLTLDGASGNEAVLAPGASIGTLTVTGDVDFADFATLTIEVGGGNADKLVVSGNLDLTALNDKLVLNPLGFVPNGTYTIVQYDTLLSYGNSNSNLWQFADIVDNLGFSPGEVTIDYGTGSSSAITITVIPEPSAFVLAAIGLFGVWMFGRARRRM